MNFVESFSKHIFCGLLTLALIVPTVKAADYDFIILASTTSTRDSGLFDFILPMFTKTSGIEVRVVAVGTGQAIKLAKNGDADLAGCALACQCSRRVDT